MHTCDHDCDFEQDQTRAHLLHHIKKKIPTKIPFGLINLLPTRQDFLDLNFRAAFRKQVDTEKPLLFHTNAVTEKNNWEDGVLKYKIYLFGVMPCGSKTCVILNNVPVYFDIMVPSGTSKTEFDAFLRGQFITKNLAFTGLGDIDLKRLHGFQKGKRPYKRIFFNNLQDRSKCLNFIAEHNKELKAAGKPKLETAADDPGFDNYFPKVAREYRFATAGWNRFEKYEVLPTSTTTNCSYSLLVDITDFKPLDKARRAEFAKPTHFLSKVMDRDPTMVASWDIETYRTIQNGMVPTPADRDFTIFMMNSSYFWHHTDDAMFEVCCVDVATRARKGISLVIECGIERNVLEAHMEVVGRLSPDILVAFNGGSFDWPLYKEKCWREQLLVKLKTKFSSLPISTKGKWADTEESVKKWCFARDSIKIDAETKHDLECVAHFAGVLDTDCLPTFIQLYTRMEVRKAASMNFFCTKNGIPLKEDMPYKRMFRIYERALKLSAVKSCHCGQAQEHCGLCKESVRELDYEPLPGSTSMEGTEYSDKLYDDVLTTCCHCAKRNRNLKDMADVGYYCTVDCLRPQQLYVKRTIIPDKRELSTMSYVSLFDSFYRANGMKVRNVIGAYCYKRDIAFSNARTDKKDIDKDHYPGAWVFPPHRGLHSDGFVDIDVIVDGQKIKKRVRCRPITGLDFSSLYPSLMMTYNLSPDMVVYTREEAEQLASEGYSLHHVNSFAYEQGPKKGQGGNKHLTKEGWTVRHNGVFNPKTDKKVVTNYTKYDKLELFDGSDNPPTVLKIKSDADKTPEQLEQIAAAKKCARRPIYEPTHGRDALAGESMGIFAFIVKKLFDKRVPMKAEFVRLEKLKEQMELNKLKTIDIPQPDGSVLTLDYKADVCFQRNKIDSKQKALKVLMNTFYGESGNYMSSIYELIVAAGITTAGQENIKKVAAFVEGKGFIVHYGDSVTGDTPIICRFPDKSIGYRTIDQLGRNWQPYGIDKEASDCNVDTWTETGWTRINRVIRHRTDKEIYRVLTHTGCVDVTADHSLLNENAEKVTPAEVKVGSKLLHSHLPHQEVVNTTIDSAEAFSMGFFWADGSCGKYGSGSSVKYSWAINNQNLDFLNRAKDELDIVYAGTGIGFKILPTLESSGVYKLVPTGQIKPMVDKYRKLFYDTGADINGKAYKRVPDEILNADLEIRKLFVEGYYAGDGDKDKHGYFRADNRGKIGSAGLYHLFTNIGYDVSINTRVDKPDIYRLTGNPSGQKFRKSPNEIKKITNLGSTTQYVYDLETENHHFAAGIGRMIVHNTDSVYISCPDSVYEKCDAEYNDAMAALIKEFEGVANVPEPTTEAEIEFKRRRVELRLKWWTQQVDITMKVMSKLKEEVSDYLLSDNGTLYLNMAYEEVGYPTVFTGKKKYFLIPHIEKINFYPKELFIRGIDIIKQGQAKISKDLGMEFMRETLSPENEREMMDIAKDKIRKYYKTKQDPALFALSGRYKPTKKNVPVQTFVARMKELQAKYKHDPALVALYEPPEPGDKFDYIIVKKDQKFTLQGNKIDIKKGDQMEFLRVFRASQETPNPMEIDLDYYMKNTIVGIFARFIACYPEFQPLEGKYDPHDKEQYRLMDMHCVDNASAYLKAFCDGITGHDKTALTKLGRDYRAIYNRVDKALRKDIGMKYGGAGYIIHGFEINNVNDEDKAQSTRIITQMKEKAKEMAGAGAGAAFIALNRSRETGLDLFSLRRIYNGTVTNLSRIRAQLCDRREHQIIEQLYQEVPKVARVIYRYEKDVINLIENMRTVKFEDDIDLDDEDVDLLNDLGEDIEIVKNVHSLMLDLIAVYRVRANTLDIVNQIELERVKMINEPLIPKFDAKTEAKKESTTFTPVGDFNWM